MAVNDNMANLTTNHNIIIFATFSNVFLEKKLCFVGMRQIIIMVITKKIVIVYWKAKIKNKAKILILPRDDDGVG